MAIVEITAALLLSCTDEKRPGARSMKQDSYRRSHGLAPRLHHDATMAALRTILVAHDFSAQAQQALAWAKDLAALAGARVHLLHAVQTPMLHALAPTGGFEVALPETVTEGALFEARRNLREAANGAVRDVDVHVVEGPPTETICRVAEELHADLIVMGTHARAGFGHFLLGSVAERTLRRAPCPVLTVRAPDDARRHPA